MIDFASIKRVAQAQIAEHANIQASRVRWVDEPSGPLEGALPVIWLRLMTVARLGIEEERLTDEPNGDDQQVDVVGQRSFTLSVRVESFTPDISDPLHAQNIVEAIITRSRRSSAVETRHGIYSIQSSTPAKWFSYVEATRPVTVFVFDFLCSTVDVDTDSSDGAGGWIGEAIIHGDVHEGDIDHAIDLSIDAR